jgi:hypothetical protein
LFISATKENFEEFRERIYEAVRHIHVTVSLTISFSIQIIKMLWRKKTKEDKERVRSRNISTNRITLILLKFSSGFETTPAFNAPAASGRIPCI